MNASTRPDIPDAGPEITISQLRMLEQHLGQTAAIAEILAIMGATEDLAAACSKVADRLKAEWNAGHVALAISETSEPHCRLLSISGLSDLHRNLPVVVDAESVLLESIAQGDLVQWTAHGKVNVGGLLAHKKFAKAHDTTAVLSSPLRDPTGNLVGAWLVAGDAATLRSHNVLEFMRAAESPLSISLALVSRAEPSRLQRMIRSVRKGFGSGKGRVICLVTMVVCLLLCLPMRYRPRCECTVEPVTRRFVAAPFAGPLEQAFVSAGDEVQKDQLLARMDGREVRWELAGARADLNRAMKERAGYMAEHDSGQAEVARYDVDRLQSKITLLESRHRNLEIRSPVSGIVVNGDLDEAIGMPLETGQNLFEVAPLDEMVFELAVPEDDFVHVSPGMPVNVRLNAYPTRDFKGIIGQIHPRSELREQRNVFIADVAIDNKTQVLRPGMQGRASIETVRKPLGWILFHRPYHALVSWLGL